MYRCFYNAQANAISEIESEVVESNFAEKYTIGDYLSNDIRTGTIPTDTPEFDEAEKSVKDRLSSFINNKGTKSVDHFHKLLGKTMWENVGMARNAKGLETAISDIRQIREDFYKDVFVPGDLNEFNPELEKATRVADFLELGELFAIDALNRNESCGGHFREESVELDGEQKGEALRNDKDYAYSAAWEWTGDAGKPTLNKEELEFNDIELKQRSYK